MGETAGYFDNNGDVVSHVPVIDSWDDVRHVPPEVTERIVADALREANEEANVCSDPTDPAFDEPR